MVQVEYHPPGTQMRVIQHFTRILTRSARHPGLSKDLHHLIFCSLRRPLFDEGIHLIHMFDACFGCLLTSIIDQVYALYCPQ